MTEFTVTRWLREPRADAGLHFLEGDRTWRFTSFADLAGRVAAMAEILGDQGLAGERLALVAETSEDFIVQVFATLATGGTCVPIPFFLTGQDRGDHDRLVNTILETARPTRMVTTKETEPPAGWAMAIVPSYGELSPLGEVKIVDSDAPAMVKFSSGTAEAPKCVRVRRSRLDSALARLEDWSGVTPSDRLATWLPLWMIELPLWLVATQFDSMLMTPRQFLRRPDRWLRCVGEMGCTASAAASFAYHHVVTAVRPETLAGCRFDDWRMAGVFGEPLRAADIDEFVDAYGPLGFRRHAFCPVYSMTETAGPITGTRPEEEPVVLDESAPPHSRAGVLAEAVHRAAPGESMIGAGRPLDGVQVEVRLPDGSEAEEGVLGEVWVGEECLADGYEGGDDFGEWLATGDVGCFRDGVLFILGRLVDTLNIRGQLVTAPFAEQRVKEVLPEARSLVVLPSRASGAGITVVVESVAGLSPERLEHARLSVSELLKNTEVDVLVVAPGGIPRTANGKPQRRETWARYVSSRGKGAPT